MKLIRIATPLMAVAIMSSVPFMALAQNSQVGNQTSNNTIQQDGSSPGSAQATQGYRDGVQAAKLDKLANRPVSFKASHLYTNPPVKKDARDAYRSAFQSGYESASG